MSSEFDRWEKDPFFAAAEEVQDSFDRLESVYMRWLRERKAVELASPEVQRELQSALGTAKWQLEEFEKAVRKNDEAMSVSESTRARHNQFWAAIGCRILTIEKSLKETSREEGQLTPRWIRLDEGEAAEFASFLGPPPLQDQNKVIRSPSLVELTAVNESLKAQKEVPIDSSGNLDQTQGSKAEKAQGHRRVASATADIGAWKIMIPAGEDTSGESSDDPVPIFPMVQSLSQISRALDSKSNSKRHKYGLRKWNNDIEESAPLRNSQQSQGMDVRYVKSKSSLNSCDVEAHNKNIRGWIGELHRQFQRFQYYLQYRLPVHVCLALFVGLVVLLIVFGLAFGV